jgi:hypothetical protein
MSNRNFMSFLRLENSVRVILLSILSRDVAGANSPQRRTTVKQPFKFQFEDQPMYVPSSKRRHGFCF